MPHKSTCLGVVIHGMDEVNSTPAPKRTTTQSRPLCPQKAAQQAFQRKHNKQSTTSAVPRLPAPTARAASETMHPARPGAAILFQLFHFTSLPFGQCRFFILHAPPRRKGRPRQYRAQKAHSSHRRRGRAACSAAAGHARRQNCAGRPSPAPKGRCGKTFAFSANSTNVLGKGPRPACGAKVPLRSLPWGSAHRKFYHKAVQLRIRQSCARGTGRVLRGTTTKGCGTGCVTPSTVTPPSSIALTVRFGCGWWRGSARLPKQVAQHGPRLVFPWRPHACYTWKSL